MYGVDMNELMAFESGELEEGRVIQLFQQLTDNGVVWQLQGFYGRTAIQLIDEGLITVELDSVPPRAREIIEQNKKDRAARIMTNLMRGR